MDRLLRCVAIISFCVMMCVSVRSVQAQLDELIEITPVEQIQDGLVIKGPQVVWKTAINGTLSAGLSSSVLVVGDVLVLTLNGAPADKQNGFICALNKDDSSVKWIRNIGGINQQPLGQDSNLVFGAIDGKLYTVSLETGKEVWTKQTESWKKSGMHDSPVQDEKHVYAGFDEGILYALDKVNGEEQWRFSSGGTMYAQPLLQEGNLYFASSNGFVFCVSAEDGSGKWKVTIQPDIFFLNLLYEEGVITLFWCEYVPGERTVREAVTISTFDAATGEALSTKTVNDSASMSWPINAAQKIFFSLGDTLHAMNFRTKEQAWTFKSNHEFNHSIILMNDVVYIADSEVLLSDRSQPTFIYAFDINTGKKIWEHETASGTNESLLVTDTMVCAYSKERDMKNRERYYIVFLDVLTGEERGKVFIKPDEKISQQVSSINNEFYVTTENKSGNSFVYKMTFEN